LVILSRQVYINPPLYSVWWGFAVGFSEK